MKKILNQNIAYQTLLYKISDLTQDQIDNVVRQAQSMGISQDQINQGLELIKQLKKISPDQTN